jgi:hypothetical protein
MKNDKSINQNGGFSPIYQYSKVTRRRYYAFKLLASIVREDNPRCLVRLEDCVIGDDYLSFVKLPRPQDRCKVKTYASVPKRYTVKLVDTHNGSVKFDVEIAVATGELVEQYEKLARRCESTSDRVVRALVQNLIT